MGHMTTADFDRRYEREGDPWGYETSEYERRKYAATLAACGPGPFARALELGGSIGVFTALLAPRCESLETIDASPSAVETARRCLGAAPGVTARLGTIPADLPAGPFELVVASEILYYLEAPALEATLSALSQALVPGGRLVAVHWRPPGGERPFDADAVHTRLAAEPWLRPLEDGDTADYRLDVLERL